MASDRAANAQIIIIEKLSNWWNERWCRRTGGRWCGLSCVVVLSTRQSITGNCLRRFQAIAWYTRALRVCCRCIDFYRRFVLRGCPNPCAVRYGKSIWKEHCSHSIQLDKNRMDFHQKMEKYMFKRISARWFRAEVILPGINCRWFGSFWWTLNADSQDFIRIVNRVSARCGWVWARTIRQRKNEGIQSHDRR